MWSKFVFSVFVLTIVIDAEQFQSSWELDYLFPSTIFEPALKLTPSYMKGHHSYSFTIPPPSKLYGPHLAFYLFAGQPTKASAEIVINQDGQFFQTLSEKQYWQSNKIPVPLTTNETTIELYIRNGDQVGSTYTVHARRAVTP